MKPNDILREVLSDPELGALLQIGPSDIQNANMDICSPNDNIEVIKAIIKGYYHGTGTQQLFNEIKRIKGI